MMLTTKMSPFVYVYFSPFWIRCTFEIKLLATYFTQKKKGFNFKAICHSTWASNGNIYSVPTGHTVLKMWLIFHLFSPAAVDGCDW